jgi:hypothetical protein
MPPKNAAPSKKTEAKAKAKIIEDKTFGLKNKNKSSKVNKYIQQVEHAVKQKSGTARKEEDQAALLKKRREEEEKKKAELAALFKPAVTQPKVPFGVDPKTVLCAFWKAAGSCAKGDKCKYSHDPAVERKAEKINLYSDKRDEGGLEQDTMDTWDQDKLEHVVTKKHGARTTTDIVCRFFLEAIENKKYGWFWECPNGGDKCKYRHALPPGYVLRSAAAAKMDEEGERISLEEFLETERYKIEKSTPVTAESFAKWKTVRRAKAAEEEASRKKAREAEVKAGRLNNVSGRDLFAYNPDLVRDDDEAMEVDYNAREDDVQEDVQAQVENPDLFLDEDLENLEISEEESIEEESNYDGDEGDEDNEEEDSNDE